ncbi:MAG TPA: response regulator transcription factor [Acidimicrobiales bacterium]|nr:response regulator transcription factor [Acidimicrobiales bacterium]
MESQGSGGAGSTQGRPQPARLLVVDDDDDVRAMVSQILSADGYRVLEARDGKGALEAVVEQSPDLVLLDVVLGGEDGMDVLATLRRTSDVPVIMLTGKGQEIDRVLGLKLGADDYVVKPFSPAELSARIGSVLRRSRPREVSGRMQFADLAIDPTTREIILHGQVVEMTAKEFDLLAFLARSPRQVFSRAQLLENVWESSSDWQGEGTVTEHVRRIRRKIEEDPDNPRWVRTVRGVGYRFEP